MTIQCGIRNVVRYAAVNLYVQWQGVTNENYIYV